MERLNTKKTFEYQHRLPKLPIPDLQDTPDSFLEWVQPLLNEEELESAKYIVNNFYSNEDLNFKGHWKVIQGEG